MSITVRRKVAHLIFEVTRVKIERLREEREQSPTERQRLMAATTPLSAATSRRRKENALVPQTRLTEPLRSLGPYIPALHRA
jgi:hypothetical protein